MAYSTSLLHHVRRVVGENIHRRRVRMKYTLSRLAAESGLSERLLDLYEIGKGDIDLHDIMRIACALRVEVGFLMKT